MSNTPCIPTQETTQDVVRKALLELAHCDGSPINVANAHVLAARVRRIARHALVILEADDKRVTELEAARQVDLATERVLYKTRDPDAPETIKDRNGEVVLGLCRKCGRAEVELDEPCVPAARCDCGIGMCTDRPDCRCR